MKNGEMAKIENGEMAKPIAQRFAYCHFAISQFPNFHFTTLSV
jgi:hypothetical protein